MKHVQLTPSDVFIPSQEGNTFSKEEFISLALVILGYALDDYIVDHLLSQNHMMKIIGINYVLNKHGFRLTDGDGNTGLNYKVYKVVKCIDFSLRVPLESFKFFRSDDWDKLSSEVQNHHRLMQLVALAYHSSSD